MSLHKIKVLNLGNRQFYFNIAYQQSSILLLYMTGNEYSQMKSQNNNVMTRQQLSCVAYMG